jgi:hypothetical protein
MLATAFISPNDFEIGYFDCIIIHNASNPIQFQMEMDVNLFVHGCDSQAE